MGKFKLFIFLVTKLTKCDIAVYSSNTSTVFEVEYESLGATFGPDLLDDGLYGILQLADPAEACGKVNKTDLEPSVVGNRTFYPILLVKRGECQFDDKVSDLSDTRIWT